MSAVTAELCTNRFAVAWFQSYLHGRSHYVRCGVIRSSSAQLIYGVRQGSVLGPILFIMYNADLVALIDKHGICPHLYADDTQIYGSTRHSAVNDLERRLSACIDDVYSWMQSNRLQLNTSKTELLWCSLPPFVASIYYCGPHAPRISAVAITPSTTMRDLGIYIDADLSMRLHVKHHIKTPTPVVNLL